MGKMLKMRKTKKIYKNRRGGKLPKQTIDSQVEENNNSDDDGPSMRDLINRYNRLIGPGPTIRNEVVYSPETPPTSPPSTPPRRNQMPDYDSDYYQDDDEEIIERRNVPGAPRRNRRRPEEIEEIEEDELFARPVLRRQNGLNEREFAVAFPQMPDSDTEEEIIVDNNDYENQLPRQGGRKRKTTKKRKNTRKKKTTRKRKNTRKH